MDQIQGSLDNIANLSDDELAALQESIVSAFEAVDTTSLTQDTVDTLNMLADASDMVRNEIATRSSAAAALAAQAEEAANRIKGNGTDQEDHEAEEAPVDDSEEVVMDDSEDPTENSTVELSSETSEAVAETVVEAEAETVVVEEAELATEEVAETVTEAPVEAEAAIEEVAEEPVVAELATTEEQVEDTTTELSVEESVVESPVEAEASIVEETTQEPVAELATVNNQETESLEEAVTASNTPEELSIEAPADRLPAKTTISAPVITAGANLPGVPAGSVLPNRRAIAQSFLDRKKELGRTQGAGDNEQVLVASITREFSEERTLFTGDFEGNSKKIKDVVSPEAMIAAGGLSAPVETVYDIFDLGETSDRPVRDSLPIFNAERGGIRYMTAPVITDLTGAVSVWTLQDDIDAATPGAPDPVKPCLRVAAGTEVTVYTDAIPLCLTFGNLSARAYPELVERHIELAMVAHARFAETRLLTRIGALSTSVSAAKQLGAARDIFVQIDQAAAGYRSRYRLDPKLNLRVILPVWFRNALRADLTKQIPGDGPEATFDLADAMVNTWFASRGINVTWTLDGEAGQVFGAQAPGALNAFPSKVVWYLFAEGTFLFLDGGTLDLGLVRDSTLNSTNDYKIFLETFEGVAKVGVESLRVTSDLVIVGSSSATTAINN